MKLPRDRLVPLIVGCALFMENLDSTIIATALPSIARWLGEDPLHLSLAIIAYLLALSIFIPLSGWMADRYGARSVFRNAILIFVVGSIACAAAQSVGQLVAARQPRARSAAAGSRRLDDARRRCRRHRLRLRDARQARAAAERAGRGARCSASASARSRC